MDIAYYRKLLLEKQAQLQATADVNDAATATVELDQSRVGRLSRMDAMQGQAMSQAAQLRRGEELQRIKAALKRIDEDEYGYCLDCGDEIAEGRLKIKPAVAMCIKCAERST